MKRLYIWGMVLWAIGWAPGVSVPTAQAGEAKEVVERYVNAVLDQQWAVAESCWAPQSVVQSKRLGIAYTGIHAKYDYESPLLFLADSVNAGVWNCIVDSERKRMNWREVDVILKREKEKLNTTYSLGRVDGEWRIFPKLHVLTEDWPIWTTKYVRLHCRDKKRVDEIMLDYLDEFVDSTTSALAFTPEQMQTLSAEKIDYFVLEEKELFDIVGSYVSGAEIRSSNSVVSGRFTHVHEIAHVLIEIAVGESGAWAPSFLIEGMAVALGGRWGLSPNVAMQYSELVTSYHNLMLDRTLPSEDAEEDAGAFWLSYWAGAIFCDCLIQTLGPDAYLDMYRRFSATSRAEMIKNRASVMDSIGAVVGMSYDRFVEKCRAESQRYMFSGIQPTLRKPEREPDAEGQAKDFTVSVWETDTVYLFEVRSEDRVPRGALLFRCRADSGVVQQWSSLFSTQFYGRAYHGECLGLRFGVAEVGLYNYQLDRTEALFSTRMSPNNPPLWDAVSGCLRFSVERELLPGQVVQTIAQMGVPSQSQEQTE